MKLMLFTIFEWLFESGVLKYIAGIAAVVMLLRWCNKPDEVRPNQFTRLTYDLADSVIARTIRENPTVSASEIRMRMTPSTLHEIDSIVDARMKKWFVFSIDSSGKLVIQ